MSQSVIDLLRMALLDLNEFAKDSLRRIRETDPLTFDYLHMAAYDLGLSHDLYKEV